MDSLKAKIAKQDSALEGEKKKFNALDKGLNQARTSEYLDLFSVLANNGIYKIIGTIYNTLLITLFRY